MTDFTTPEMYEKNRLYFEHLLKKKLIFYRIVSANKINGAPRGEYKEL